MTGLLRGASFETLYNAIFKPTYLLEAFAEVCCLDSRIPAPVLVPQTLAKKN